MSQTVTCLTLTGGLLGLFVGLVQALSDLDRLDRVGSALATAMLAPFYGVFFSEIVLRLVKVRLQRKFAARLAPTTPCRDD